MIRVRSWDPTAEQSIGMGVTLLEASAGTGKTYNITSILLRLVAARNIKMREIVVVTFTRAATAELEDRIRTRLSDAVAFLEGRNPAARGDDVLEHLRAGAAKVGGDLWLRRLRTAQESFDECLISTIHGFCQRMLQQHAFESQSDFDLELLKDTSELRAELVDDWLSRELHPCDPERYGFLTSNGFGRDALLKLADKALLDPDAPILPSTDGAAGQSGSSLAALERARFAAWVRAEFDRRMTLRRAQSYQDLMRKLARVLRDANPGRDPLKLAIGTKFRAALIDEFQDTDSVQWDIFREVFGDDGHRLFLIGDPKQAIYGFRGANVQVYLSAKVTALPRCYTMQRNYRSDARLLDALNHLMDRPGFFGERNIDYVAVEAPARDAGAVDRLRFPVPWSDPFTAPLQLRFVDQRLDPAAKADEAAKPLTKGRLDALMPSRVAEDIATLLAAGAQLHDPSSRRAGDDGFRAMHPGDIAVLTRTGIQAAAVQKALLQIGIPSVLQGGDSVLQTEEAFELQLWMQALSAPGHDEPARTAATTRLFGRDGTLLAKVDAQEPEALRHWEQWLSRLSAWRELFAKHGFLRTLRTALQQDTLPAPDDAGVLEDVTVRLLRRPDGDRRLTNLWHLAELLHEAETAGRLHLAGLLSWLQRQRVHLTMDSDFAQLRLERDDEAVSVMTMHKSKGLEFPVVFLPYLSDAKRPSDDEAQFVALPQQPAKRVLDVRGPGESDETMALVRAEHDKEQLRLFYVGVTRARYRCVLYAGHTNQLAQSALAAPLHAPREVAPADRVRAAAERVSTSTRDDLWADLAELASSSAQRRADKLPTIALSLCEPTAGVDRPRRAPEQRTLQARDFLRFGLDHSWRRHSYTSITYGKEVAYVDSGDDREGFDPDPEEGVVLASAAGEPASWLPDIEVPQGAESVPLARFPAGADAGTFFHAFFEHADFTWAHPGASGGPDEMKRLLAKLLPVHGFDAEPWADELTNHLGEVLRTPLGSLLGSTRLCDIAQTSRLNELRFDFPIAGGSSYARERGDRPVDSKGIVEALRLRRPSLDERAMRRAYLDGLDRFGRLAGFMTGSIDLVFRHTVDGRPRWFVADYKSNRLDPRRVGRYPVQHFCNDGMRFEMEQHHYYVQYHLYVLALHRYLRFRLGKAYDYEQDMGGVFYLFFRGMIGDGTPQLEERRHGCFYDKPPFAVIRALDELFERKSPAEQGGAP